MDNPIEHNKRAWDQRVREGRRFTKPVDDEELKKDPQRAMDPWASAEGVAGKRVLCLGAGGGRQAIVYARGGGIVTVVDVSAMQLELDRKVAIELGLGVRTVHTSMDDLSTLLEGEFDIVVHPVSTCYVPDIERVYKEVARVLRGSGLYISQHKQPTSMQADIRRTSRGYEVIEPYYRTGPLPEPSGSTLHREPGTLEFLHRWEQIVGGMCRAGFVVEDLSEPYHGDAAARLGSFEDRSRFIAPYVRIKARRVGGGNPGLIESLIRG